MPRFYVEAALNTRKSVLLPAVPTADHFLDAYISYWIHSSSITVEGAWNTDRASWRSVATDVRGAAEPGKGFKENLMSHLVRTFL